MQGSALVQLTISSDSIVASSYHAGLAGQRTVALSIPTTNIVGAGNAGKSSGALVTIGVAWDHATCPQRIVTLYRNQYGVEAINLFP